MKAGRWMGAAQLLSYMLRLISSLVLTRLLAPDLFGIISIVWTVTTVVSMLSDVGLIPVVVQSEDGDQKHFLDTVWAIQVIRGFVIWAVVLLLAVALYAVQHLSLLPPTSSLASPQLPALLSVAGMSAAISGFSSTNICLAYRKLQVGPVLFIETGGQAVSLVVSVVLASIWHSVWALVLAGIFSSAAQAAASHRFLNGFPNSFGWHAETIKRVLNFGKPVMASSTISVLASNADKLILGLVAAPTEVGWYVVAFTIVNVGSGFISRIVNAVALAALSETRRRSDAEFLAAYRKLRIVSDTATLTVGGLLAALGPMIIDLLYDDRYGSAGRVLQLMGCSLLLSRYSVFQQVYMSLGRPVYSVWINLASLLTQVVCVPLAYQLVGFNAAIVAIALRDVATIPLIAWLNRTHGLNQWRLEARLLLVFPAVFLAAEAIKFGFRRLLM